jgi:hypothetical protein
MHLMGPVYFSAQWMRSCLGAAPQHAEWGRGLPNTIPAAALLADPGKSHPIFNRPWTRTRTRSSPSIQPAQTRSEKREARNPPTSN